MKPECTEDDVEPEDRRDCGQCDQEENCQTHCGLGSRVRAPPDHREQLRAFTPQSKRNEADGDRGKNEQP